MSPARTDVVSCLSSQDRVYWTDLEDEAIYSVNRLTGHDVAMLAQHLNNPLDVVVFHELRQPTGKTSEYASSSVI